MRAFVACIVERVGRDLHGGRAGVGEAAPGAQPTSHLRNPIPHFPPPSTPPPPPPHARPTHPCPLPCAAEEIFAQVSECGGPSLNRTPVAAPAASGLPSEHSTPSMPCLPSVTDASAAPVEAAPAAEQEAADGWAVSAAVEEAALPAADQSSDALAVTAAEDSSAGTWAAEASGNLFAAAQVSEVCEVADVAVDADEEEETREVAADAESFEMASASADAEVASAACMSADSEVAPAMDKL